MTRKEDKTSVEVLVKTRDRLIKMKYKDGFKSLDDVIKKLLSIQGRF